MLHMAAAAAMYVCSTIRWCVENVYQPSRDLQGDLWLLSITLHELLFHRSSSYSLFCYYLLLHDAFN